MASRRVASHWSASTGATTAPPLNGGTVGLACPARPHNSPGRRPPDTCQPVGPQGEKLRSCGPGTVCPLTATMVPGCTAPRAACASSHTGSVILRLPLPTRSDPGTVRCLPVRDLARARLSDINTADSQAAYDGAAASFGYTFLGVADEAATTAAFKAATGTVQERRRG